MARQTIGVAGKTRGIDETNAILAMHRRHLKIHDMETT